MSDRNRLLIIGIGNEYRSDDGAGLIAAQRLQQIRKCKFAVIEQSGEGTALMEAWQNAENVILIDAVKSGAAAGTIHRLDVHAQPLPQRFFNYSSHAFGLVEAVELARTLNRLPRHLIIYGIEGKTFDAGAGLSAEVENAAIAVADRILAENIFS